jgi:hypothetical protein
MSIPVKQRLLCLLVVDFTFDGNNLEIVSDIVYLGVHFSRTGSYLNTKKRNIDKAYKAMYAVLKKGRLHNLSIKCQYDLFHNKGNNKITELRTILQRESQNS